MKLSCPILTLSCSLIAEAVFCGTLYVDTGSLAPVPPYRTPATAARTIQDAVDAAVAGDEVMVASGVYAEGGRLAPSGGAASRVVVDKPIRVRSSNGPESTFIVGVPSPKEVANSSDRIDWYVDSINGNDANAGTNSGAPLRTIAALLAKRLQSGQIIGLARNSRWREQLNIPASGMTVIAYGTGERPLLDCSDVVTNAWELSFGRTNVYETTCRVASVGERANFVGVWQNDKRLVRAASIDACETNAGSYFVSSDWVSPFVLYLHATDSTHPTNWVVEYSARLYGIDGGVYNGITNTTLEGIWTRRNYCNNGSMVFTGIARDCVASEGSKHNLLVGPGSYLKSVIANEAYYTETGIMFVFNANSSNYDPVTFEDCVAVVSSDSPSSSISGWYGHVNVSGAFGTATYRRCIGSGLVTGISTGSTNTVIMDCAITNRPGGSGSACVIANGPINVTNSILHSDSQQAIALNDSHLNLFGSLLCGQCSFSILNQGDSITAIANTFASPGWALYSYSQPVTFYSNAFLGSVSVGIFDTNNYTGDFNYGNVGGRYEYSNYSLPQWRALTGNDLHEGTPPDAPKLVSLLNESNSTRCIYLASGARLGGFSLKNGIAGLGGGIYCESDGTLIENCVLTGNDAKIGGGIFGGTIRNCTISANSAAQGGGVNGSKVENSIVYHNSAPVGANYYASTLNFSCTTPLPAQGDRNIANDPMLVDIQSGDLHLLPDSPCIDAGTNVAGNVLVLPRVMDGNFDGIRLPDMGAYEFNPYRFESTLGMRTDGFLFTIRGEPGRKVRIERSRDLVNWQPLLVILLSTGRQTLIDPSASGEPVLFYRTVSTEE